MHIYPFILSWFGPLEMRFAIAMALSIVIGYISGAERELRGKDAGISTHILVIAGAMIFTLVSTLDVSSPSRIAAQVVTGIGFLGAGLILRDQNGGVKNLTTAASLWVSAAIGVALGFGLYVIAVIAGILITLIARIPRLHHTADR